MFQIFVDSGANLPATEVEKYGINVLVFVNDVNGKAIKGFEPGLSLEEERAKGAEYYKMVREGAEVKTSLVNSDEFESHFRKVLDCGEDVLYISLSKNISGTYNAARIAADDLLEEYPDRKIRLVDSLNASLAQGILAIYAYEMREEGKDIDEIADTLEGYSHQMNGVFTVGDLKYLAHTGRVSNVKAFVANRLNIKPLLKGNAEGFIVQFKLCRGRKSALNELVNLVCNNITNPENQILGIAHADAYEESLTVVKKIQERVKVRRVINTSYDFCTGSHVGPDTIALFFMAKDRELDN